MTSRTIPEPSQDEVTIARTAVTNQAGFAGLDVQSEQMTAFLNSLAAVQAQHMAEIRWLRNMTHDPNALEAFLAARRAQ